MNGKLRLSYTLLRLWMEGKEKEVASTYLRLDTKMTPAMKRGKEFDKYVEEFVAKNKKLPDELGGGKLEPTAQPKFIIEAPFSDLLVLKGELDILNGKEIIEVKCSSGQDAADFAENGQLPFYFFLADLYTMTHDSKGLDIEKGWIYRYDPVKRLYDTALVWKTQRHLVEVREKIEKYGPEIREYLLGEGVL